MPSGPIQSFIKKIRRLNRRDRRRLLSAKYVKVEIPVSMDDKDKGKNQAPAFEKATFAGGCFWCLDAAIRQIGGVIDVMSGYTGGQKENPTYEEVSSGTTGHYEAVQITFDPSKISYDALLQFFWRNIDPTDPGGQFADRGSQYQTAIFYHNEEQKILAERSKEKLEKSGKFSRPIATKIIPFTKFYEAESYHQNYSEKNPIRFKLYKTASGRESYLKKTWKDETAK